MADDPNKPAAGDPADPAVDPNADPNPDPNADPPADPNPNPDPAADADKEKNRSGYEQRQLKKQLDDLRKELDGYKRRDDDTRKAKLTEQERLKEERDNAVAEAEKLRNEAVRNKVAAEFKLPAAMSARLIGSDEEALRADAAELAKLLPKPRVGSPTDPLKDGPNGIPTYTRSQLRANPKLAMEIADKYRRGEVRVIEG
jgi:hypothetical protein